MPGHIILRKQYFWLGLCLAIVLAMLQPVPLTADEHRPVSVEPSPRYGSSLVNVNGKALLFGGKCRTATGLSDCGDLWEYDPSANTFNLVIARNDGPRPPYQRHAAASLGGRMYLYIQPENSWQDDFWLFDPTSTLWTRLAQLMIGGDTLTPFSGYLYMATWWKITDQYDPQTDDWSYGMAPPAMGDEWINTTAAIGNRLCSIGGKNWHTKAPQVEVRCFRVPNFFDNDYNQERYPVPLSGQAPTPVQNAARASWGKTIWLIGGITVDGRPSREVWQYAIGDEVVTVTRLPDLPEPREYAAAVALTPTLANPGSDATALADLPILIFGGRNATGTMASPLVYTVTVPAHFVHLPLITR